LSRQGRRSRTNRDWCAAVRREGSPGIDDRIYPSSLAGPLYPDGIPIVVEETLPELIGREAVDEVVLA
jgi:predicted GTPase